jgi:toxin CptA
MKPRLMPHSIRSSSTSAPCRLEWRPSRWVTGALLALALLSACSVLASEMPGAMAWPLAIAAAGYGGWLARREHHRSPRQLLWPVGDMPVTLNGEPLQHVQLLWRGPLAFLRWTTSDGRSGHLGWWPDTLPTLQRRELRLAVQRRPPAQPTATMAP